MDHSSGLVFRRPQAASHRRAVVYFCSAVLKHATTWDFGGAGTHGEDADFILQGLSEHLDGFILDYLRVNEDACDQTR